MLTTPLVRRLPIHICNLLCFKMLYSACKEERLLYVVFEKFKQPNRIAVRDKLSCGWMLGCYGMVRLKLKIGTSPKKLINCGMHEKPFVKNIKKGKTLDH